MNWIKTEDQLPIDKQPEDIDFRTEKILAYHKGTYFIGYFFQWEHHDLMFTSLTGDQVRGLPDYWMPLPEKPSE